jgi:hypothetical protein
MAGFELSTEEEQLHATHASASIGPHPTEGISFSPKTFCDVSW